MSFSKGSGVHQVHLAIGTPIKGQVPVLGFGGRVFGGLQEVTAID